MTHRSISCVCRRGTLATVGICHQMGRGISPCGAFGAYGRSALPRDAVTKHRAKSLAFTSYISLIGICTPPPCTLTSSLLFRTHLLRPHPIPKNALTSRWSARLSGYSIPFPLCPRTRKIDPTCWSTWLEGLTRPLVRPSPKLLPNPLRSRSRSGQAVEKSRRCYNWVHLRPRSIEKGLEMGHRSGQYPNSSRSNFSPTASIWKTTYRQLRPRTSRCPAAYIYHWCGLVRFSVGRRFGYLWRRSGFYLPNSFVTNWSSSCKNKGQRKNRYWT
jgi:hypothetical protein